MNSAVRKLAVVTGASSGIGLELARLCARDKDNYDVVIAADSPDIARVASELGEEGAQVMPVQTDLSTLDGVNRLCDVVETMGRPVDVLVANAGRGLGHAFLDQNFTEALDVVNTNIVGTIYLVHRVGRKMRESRAGRILITGSIAGLMPGTYQAVYNGSKAFLDNFGVALHHELRDSGVGVTVLMPGATATRFFERADMLDTKVGQDDAKDDPADVAKTGWDALMAGEASVVHGAANKLRAAAAHVTPDSALAAMHRNMAAPGTGSR